MLLSSLPALYTACMYCTAVTLCVLRPTLYGDISSNEVIGQKVMQVGLRNHEFYFLGLMRWGFPQMQLTIIESVDSISRDGPDCPYYCLIHYKTKNKTGYVQKRLTFIHTYNPLHFLAHFSTICPFSSLRQ